MFPRRTPLPRSADTARPPFESGAYTYAGAPVGDFWALITGQVPGTNVYSWVQIDESDPTGVATGTAFGATLDPGFAASGTADTRVVPTQAPAYEVNGNTSVPADGTVRVRLWPAGDRTYYAFEYETLTAPESGGTTNTVPVFSGPSQLQSVPFTIVTSTNAYGPVVTFTLLSTVGANPATTPVTVFTLVTNQTGPPSNAPQFTIAVYPNGTSSSATFTQVFNPAQLLQTIGVPFSLLWALAGAPLQFTVLTPSTGETLFTILSPTTNQGVQFTLLQDGSGNITQTTFTLVMNGATQTVATWTVAGSAVQTALGGLVTGTTQLITDNSTKLATTAFVQALLSGLTVGPAPNAPTGLAGTAGNAQVAWSWTAPASGVTPSSYTLQVTTDSTFATITGAGSGTFTGISGTSQTTTGMTNGTTYYARVAGVNAGAVGPWSASASATPTAAPAGIRAYNSASNWVGSTGFSTPAAAAAGDVLAVFVLTLAVPSTPSGWTGRAQDASGAANPESINLYTKIAAGGAETFSFPSDSTDVFSAICVVIEKTAFDASRAQGLGASGISISGTSVAPTTSSDVGVAAYGNQTTGSPGTIALPAGLSALGSVTFAQTVSGTTYQGVMAVGSVQLSSSSAWNPGTATASTSGYGTEVTSVYK
jgi:hypothetical protein